MQELRNTYASKYPGPAGETRAIPIITGIGRGIGRTAVHELTHQLLGSQVVDGREDRSSYESRRPIAPSSSTASCTGQPPALHWKDV